MAKRRDTKAPAETIEDPPPHADGTPRGTITDERAAGMVGPAKTEKTRSPELREKLGEPPPVAGAKLDEKTGRVESAPGFDPKRRRPQKA